MPFIQGTATDYLDLLDQFVTFVTDSSAQQTPGTPGPGMGPTEVWAVNANTTSGFTVDGVVYLEAPGVSGTENIFVNIKTISDVGNQFFLWRLQGATSFDSVIQLSGDDPNAQPGAINIFEDSVLKQPRFLLDDDSFNFTIVANGRRAVIKCNIGTNIETMYVGFLTPFANPTEYPVPIFIGGTHSADAATTVTGGDHFWMLYDNTTATGDGSSSYLRGPDGVWYRLRDIGNSVFTGKPTATEETMLMHPPSFNIDGGDVIYTNRVPPEHIKWPCMPCINEGGAPSNPQVNAMGVLDGVFWTPGFNISTDDLLQESGIDFLVFENIFRKGWRDFACVQLS